VENGITRNVSLNGYSDPIHAPVVETTCWLPTHRMDFSPTCPNVWALTHVIIIVMLPHKTTSNKTQGKKNRISLGFGCNTYYF
jgi:hypothetical protein